MATAYLNNNNNHLELDAITAYGANEYYDLVYAYGGNDTLNGGARNDTVYAGSGSDLIYGRDGNDILDGDEFNTVSGTARDSVYGGNGNDTLYGGEDNDSLLGEYGDDYLTGEDGNDFLEGSFGKDSLDGGNGNDHLRTGPDNDFAEGYFGDDSLVGWSGDDHLRAGPGNDTVVGGQDNGNSSNSGNDSLVGWTGNDLVSGGDGNDTIYGGEDNANGGSNSGNDSLNGQEGDDQIFGGNGYDYLSGGSGNDTLNDADGSINGEQGNDTLVADYTSHYYNGYGIHLGYLGQNNIRERYTGSVVLAHEGIEAFKVTGTYFEDVLESSYSSDTLSGGGDNDILKDVGDGDRFITIYSDGNFQGASQTLPVGNYNLHQLGIGNDALSSLRIDSNSRLKVTLYEHGNFTGASQILTSDTNLAGTNFDNLTSSIVVESLDFDFFDGGYGNDTLSGDFSDNVLTGGAGNDSLVGGKGLNVAGFLGKEQDFNITFLGNGNWQVTDTNLNDGLHEGTDTLTNIDQIAFEGNQLLTSQGTTVREVSDVNGQTKTIAGGRSGPTTFVVDIQGSTELALNFDVQRLANFVNDITAESQDIEFDRLATNLALNVAGGLAGYIPVIGTALSTGFAIQQTLVNYGFDLAQDQYKQQQTREAIQTYGNNGWGSIIQPNRDVIVIKDFQLGVDSIVLPTIPQGAGGYSFKNGTRNNINGVYIDVDQGTEVSRHLVFIENAYRVSNNYVFNLTEDVIQKFYKDGVVTSFNQIPIEGNNQPDQVQGDIFGENLGATYGNDYIFTKGGKDQLFGLYGDDLLRGESGDDLIYGGFNGSAPTNLPSVVSYANDGQDILQGGDGNDTLNGEGGDDILEGGSGNDTLTGGSENDIFYFNSPSDGIDLITDFTLLRDKIQLKSSNFQPTSNTNLNYNSNTGELAFGANVFVILDNTPNNFNIATDIILV